MGEVDARGESFNKRATLLFMLLKPLFPVATGGACAGAAEGVSRMCHTGLKLMLCESSCTAKSFTPRCTSSCLLFEQLFIRYQAPKA